MQGGVLSIAGELTGLFNTEHWVKEALCAQVDHDLWFPEKEKGCASTTAAKQVCRQCPVIAECLEYALQRGERHGVWGGLSERERRRMRPRKPYPDGSRCIWGHEYAKVGKRADGSCAQCRRLQNRKRAA
jgi:WhiB family redox-sensing transcriptional regulator